MLESDSFSIIVNGYRSARILTVRKSRFMFMQDIQYRLLGLNGGVGIVNSNRKVAAHVRIRREIENYVFVDR